MMRSPWSAGASFHLLIGHVLFIGLLVLAWKHFPERTIHVDSANQILKWVQQDGVEVEVYRYPAVLPQLLVKLFRGADASLGLLLLVASLAHVLVPYLIFLLAAHVWRVPWVAAAAALAAVLCTRLTFYGIVLEANYLLCYPFLLAAVLHGPLRARATPGSMALAVLALFLVVAVHPVGFLLALFVIALFFPQLPDRRQFLLGMAAATVVWGLFGRMLLPPSAYEAGLYGSVAHGIRQLDEAAGWPSLDFLLGHTWRDTTHYLPMWLLLGTVATLLVLRKHWWSAVVVVVGAVGYAVLNIITYHAGESAMMMEKNFVPLATIVSLPLMLELERSSAAVRRWSVWPFLLVVFIQFRGIAFAARPAGERLALVRELVAELRAAGVPKALVPGERLDAAGLHIHWALGSETLLASALDGPAHCVTAVVDGTTAQDPDGSGVRLGPFNNDLAPELLDARYFSLPGSAYARFAPVLGQQDERGRGH